MAKTHKTAQKKKLPIQEKHPFIGMFKGEKSDANNNKIDEFLLGEYEK